MAHLADKLTYDELKASEKALTIRIESLQRDIKYHEKQIAELVAQSNPLIMLREIVYDDIAKHSCSGPGSCEDSSI